MERKSAPFWTHHVDRDAVPDHVAWSVDRAWRAVVDATIAFSNQGGDLITQLERHRTQGVGIDTYTGSGSLANYALKAHEAIVHYNTLTFAIASTVDESALIVKDR